MGLPRDASRPFGALRLAFAGFAAIGRSPGLRRLELAYAGAITSEWAYTVALGVFAYDEGGATAVGVLGLVRMLPAALATPFTAGLADRYDRERVLAGMTTVSAAAAAASATLFYAGGSEAAIFVLAGLHAVASVPFRPAVMAFLPSLASSPEQLIAANGVSSTLEGLGTLAGPLLAGIVVATTRPGAAFAIVAAVYLVAAGLLATMRVEGRLRLARHSALPELLGGFRLLAREPEPRFVGLLIVAQTLVRGALNVLTVVVAFRLLHAGGGWVGFLSAAVGAGGLVGGFAAVTLTGPRLAVPFGVGLLLWGVPIALVAALPHRASALVLLAAVGAGNAIENVSGETLLQRLVRDELLGRVLGVLFGAATAGVALGSIVAPALIAGVGARGALVATGAFLPVLVVASWPRLRRLDRSAAPPTRELTLLEHVPMFAPLSLAAKEHLARSLVPLGVLAGREIIHQGEHGDRFYVVVSGRAEVTRDGRHRATRGPGEYFGEIALLRDVPRTATVTAIDDVELFTLDRDDFLAAVTGHARSRQAAADVVAARLAPLPSEARDGERENGAMGAVASARDENGARAAEARTPRAQIRREQDEDRAHAGHKREDETSD